MRALYPVVQPALDVHEWRIIRSLREIPPSPLRDELLDAIGALLDFARDPGCPEAQADGVPCGDAHAACDRCGRARKLLELVRLRMADA
jgi:hypothetical protein